MPRKQIFNHKLLKKWEQHHTSTLGISPGTNNSQFHPEHFLLIILQEPSHLRSFRTSAKIFLAVGG